jgi:hypothetical protein
MSSPAGPPCRAPIGACGWTPDLGPLDPVAQVVDVMLAGLALAQGVVASGVSPKAALSQAPWRLGFVVGCGYALSAEGSRATLFRLEDGATATLERAPTPALPVDDRGQARLPVRAPGRDLPHSAAICTIGDADPVPFAAANPAMRRGADAIWPESAPAQSPRAGMGRALATGLVAALAAGDPGAARVAHAAIGAPQAGGSASRTGAWFPVRLHRFMHLAAGRSMAHPSCHPTWGLSLSGTSLSALGPWSCPPPGPWSRDHHQSLQFKWSHPWSRDQGPGPRSRPLGWSREARPTPCERICQLGRHLRRRSPSARLGGAT